MNSSVSSGSNACAKGKLAQFLRAVFHLPCVTDNKSYITRLHYAVVVEMPGREVADMRIYCQYLSDIYSDRIRRKIYKRVVYDLLIAFIYSDRYSCHISHNLAYIA